MFLFPQYNAKPKTENLIWLLAEDDNLKDLKLDKNQTQFLKDALKKENMVVIHHYGVVNIYCKVENLKTDADKEKLRVLGYKTYEALKSKCDSAHIKSDSAVALEFFVEGFALGSYEFNKYFTKPKEQKLQSITHNNSKADLKKVETIVDATLWARDLINEPVNVINAPQLAKEIVKKCKGTSIHHEVLGQAKIEALKMGGILAVNKGSVDEATFTILEYKPKKAKNKKPIVLVGKGIVYDTGGLSLKPTKGSMDSMKCDMSGAAAMAATLIACAKLGVNLHLVALIPATDNRPGGNAYTPGDVIKMFDGTTIEVLNTDAEGRMILADALAYAKKYKPELVIDAATLTGAAAAAIGPFASIVMGNASQKEFDALSKAGFATHDRVVQFPFWSEYKDEMKSTIADMKNVGGAYGGMITAGKFLEHFTDYPYIHIDIAGPAFTTSRDSYRGLGGTGCGVRLLVEYLSGKANGK